MKLRFSLKSKRKSKKIVQKEKLPNDDEFLTTDKEEISSENHETKEEEGDIDQMLEDMEIPDFDGDNDSDDSVENDIDSDDNIEKEQEVGIEQVFTSAEESHTEDNTDVEEEAEALENTESPPPPYTLGDHIDHLSLFQTMDQHKVWYCDWTSQYVEVQKEKLKDVIQDYCQPFGSLEPLEKDLIGISSALINSKHNDKPEPIPVRTLSIRLRPDVPQEAVLQAVQDAFESYYNKYNIVLKRDTHLFQAIGAHGSAPMCMLANITTHKENLQRRLWLRFYHIHQLDLSLAETETLLAIVAQYESQPYQPRTPLHLKFTEACVLVQFIKEENLTKADPAPESTPSETSEWLQSTFKPSPSVLSIFYRDTKKCFPALAKQDYNVLHSTFPIVDLIWNRLQTQKYVFSTLVDKAFRFGKVHPTTGATGLDPDYCVQLAQINRQTMRQEVKEQENMAESVLRNTLLEYTELETLLRNVVTQQYLVPYNHTQNSDKEALVFQYETPKRDKEGFPWHSQVQDALDVIVKQTNNDDCVNGFDSIENMRLIDKYVRQVYYSLLAADDYDQQQFVKERSRHDMERIQQEQSKCLKLLETIILLPSNYPHLPSVMNAVKTWYEISLHSRTSNIRRQPVPIWIFKTKLGQGCVTSHQLMLLSGVLSTTVQVFDWVDTNIKHTPDHPLTKITVFRNNGERLAGFNPLNTDIPKLIKICYTLKGLQEA